MFVFISEDAYIIIPFYDISTHNIIDGNDIISS